MADKETDFSKLCKMKHERKIKLREYMKTPAWICENHNDVLFYIHRAIGSRHLPFEGITLLHFDSHPDLTVPPKMRSETVFHQEKLYDEISIADWILPAVYAGHINRVIWIKPPWSNQIKEGTFKFIVGRHKETGFVRVTCSEFYFLEEMLYSDVESLENCKDLELTVCALKPGITELGKTIHRDKFNTPSKENGMKDHVNSTATLVKKSKSDCSCNESNQLNLNFGITHTVEMITNCSNYPITMRKISLRDTEAGQRNKEGGQRDTEAGQRDTEAGQRDTEAGQRDTEAGQRDTEAVWKRCKVDVDFCVDSETNERKHKLIKHKDEDKASGCSEALDSSNLSFVLSIISKQECFLLDVDMDFFSTQNPFKALYTKEEIQRFRDIYKFEKASSTKCKDLEHCVKMHKAKIDEIEATYLYLQDQHCQNSQEKSCNTNPSECIVNHDVVLLSDAIRKREGKEPDYEMLHFAGMCLDLPHHVSSCEIIDSLMVSLKTILRVLLRPTLITMARSSHDEYTPSDQVEYIQSSLLQILLSSYALRKRQEDITSLVRSLLPVWFITEQSTEEAVLFVKYCSVALQRIVTLHG